MSRLRHSQGQARFLPFPDFLRCDRNLAPGYIATVRKLEPSLAEAEIIFTQPCSSKDTIPRNRATYLKFVIYRALLN